MSDKDSPPKKRSKHSYREKIREVIARRRMKGLSCSVRAILNEAGGGSTSTVLDELAQHEKPTPSALVGQDTLNPYQRIVALEEAINNSVAREQVLAAENAVLKNSLASARSDVDKLLAGHQDSQRMLLQGVDDLRQMVKAGQGAMPQGVVEAERQKSAPAEQSGDAILWKARHDQLLTRFVALDEKCRKMAGQLHELGVDVD